MDMATLQSRRLAALETVQDLTAQLFRAQDAVSRITKRLKTMQESQATPMPPAHPREDIEIEGMD
jgi:ABC-type protease/lipase transport system fused ATPase/permease subunit